MFATRMSTQLPRFYSWKPDPLAEATDAFSQQWGQLKGYANPPWCLIAKVLSQTKIQVILNHGTQYFWECCLTTPDNYLTL